VTAVNAEENDHRPPHARWNFRMLVGDVSFFFIGISFLDTSTALPAAVSDLGGSATYLGILLAVRQAGYFLPQLFVGHYLRGAKRLLPFLVQVAFWGRIGYFPAAAAFYFYGKTNPALALAVLMIVYAISWIGDGMGGVPWMTIVGRAIPARERGKMFAWTQVISALSRFGVAAVVGTLLAQKWVAFPGNIALLTLLCAIGLMISWGFLASIREPPAPTSEDGEEITHEDDSISIGEYMRRLPLKFRERPDFALLAATQVLATASGACMPFLVTYASNARLPDNLPATLNFLRDGGLPGIFLATQTLGLLLFAAVWGNISDRLGPRTALRGVMCLGLMCPLLALAGGLTGVGLPLFLLAYFCYGAAQDGWIMVTNYLLEAVPKREQSVYIGLMNAASAPSLLFPFAAGLIVRWVNAEMMFISAAVLLAAGFIAASRLPETRRKS